MTDCTGLRFAQAEKIVARQFEMIMDETMPATHAAFLGNGRVAPLIGGTLGHPTCPTGLHHPVKYGRF